MTSYRVIVAGGEQAGEKRDFTHEFDGEPQINLTFEHDGRVYKVVTRAHDEHEETPALHAELV